MPQMSYDGVTSNVRRPPVRTIPRLLMATVTTLVFVLVNPTQALAKTCDPGWWPSHGALQVSSVRGSIEDDHLDFTVSFIFTADNLKALTCTEDTALEVEAVVDGIVAGSGSVTG